jgi:hypothetical protein
MVFVFILILQFFSSVGSFLIQSLATGDEVHSHSSQGFSAGDDSDQNHYNGDDKEDMNEPAQRVTAYQTEQPQNEQHHRNRV